jgi:hypothetical protein
VLAFRQSGVAHRLEVVSNGLTPRGLTPTTLANLDRLTISVYGLDELLLEHWRAWIGQTAPSVELVFRHAHEGWDAWTEVRTVSKPRAQAMYEKCWYRRHCVTLERGRLFACSRIAKLARDEEGIEVTSRTTAAEIRSYLHSKLPHESCASCTPMMGLPVVPAGVQPDNRIERLQRNAIAWLDESLRKAGPHDQ